MSNKYYLTGLEKILPFGILLLAFFLQMYYLAELRTMFSEGFNQPFCGIDAEAYTNRATGLLDGSVPGQEQPFYFIPLYPAFLAALKVGWGNSILFPIFLQALLQVLGIAALYGIGRMVYAPLAGILAALGLATYNYYIFYLPCFDQALLTIPFFTLAIFFILQYHQMQKMNRLLGGGITLAGAILSRPTILLVLPVILIWLYFVTPRSQESQNSLGKLNISSPDFKKFGIQITLLIVPFLIAVAPLTWHNYQATGRFILISSNFDVNLFTGNNPDATGLDTLAHIQGQPAELRFRETMQRVGKGETTLSREVINYIIHYPDDWLALTATKVWLWFGETDERLVTPVFPLRLEESSTLKLLPMEWQALAIAAFLGLLLVKGHSLKQTVLLWLVYGVFSIVTILFFIQLRFRLPLLPFILLLAASLMASARLWQQHRPQHFWIVLIVLLLLYPWIPSLWIFIILFAGFGLIPDMEFYKKTRPGLTLLGVGIYLVLMGWWIKADALASNVSQSIDHYLGPPLAGPGVLGQTFTMDCDGLDRIKVTLGTLGNQHDQPVTFYLATGLLAQTIVYSETFAGSSVQDYQKKTFSFEPIPDSADQMYFFFLSSPTSTPENAISARGYTDTPVDRYPAGGAFAGSLDSLQQMEADFAFEAYCRMSLRDKLEVVIKRGTDTK